MTDNTEYEGKILNIDVSSIQQIIEAAGGQLCGEYFFRRYVFNTVPAKENTWLRLRTDGQKTTLAAKEIQHDGVDGTSEWEVEVSEFETTLEILQKSGLSPKGYQENRRTEFSLGDAMLAIDVWPQLKPYLEIEAMSKASVEAVAEQLGFDSNSLVGDNTSKLYAACGIDLKAVAELRFDKDSAQ